MRSSVRSDVMKRVSRRGSWAGPGHAAGFRVLPCVVAVMLTSACGDGLGGGVLQADMPDPALPAISVADVSVEEGDAGTGRMVFELGLSRASGETVTVGFSTADVSASAGADYTAVSGIVSFAPGETSAQITVQVIGDTSAETDESLRLNLSEPQNAIIAGGYATGRILDDDLPAGVVLGFDTRH